MVIILRQLGSSLLMISLKYLELDNFRNFSHFTHKFDQPVTLILGPNGSGKSNLLEAVYLLGTGSSSRTNKEQEVIRWEEKFARIEGEVNTTNLAVVVQGSGKKYLVNSKQQSLKEFLSQFYVVLFQPQDLNLLSGSPDNRRRFLNQLLGTYDYEYLHALTQYKKAIQQRNRLLSEGARDKTELSVWTDHLVEYGRILQTKRNQVVVKLNALLSDVGITLEYLRSPRVGRLAEKLKQLEPKERRLGFTLVGPQRDDLVLYETKINLGTYGSRGQQRIAITRLKLAQLKIIEESIVGKPVLLLDDIFSELDANHQDEIVKLLYGQQTILTSSHLDDPIVQTLQESSTQILSLSEGSRCE